MSNNVAFATKLPAELKKALDIICKKLGLKKNFVIESALREKIEDLIDTYDLEESIKEATGFTPWEKVKEDSKKNKI